MKTDRRQKNAGDCLGRPAAHVDRPAAHVDRPAALVDRPAAHVDRPAAHVGRSAAYGWVFRADSPTLEAKSQTPLPPPKQNPFPPTESESELQGADPQRVCLCLAQQDRGNQAAGWALSQRDVEARADVQP
eukprot:361726-Chlamydomonas_euryale.AAC.1